MSTFTELKTEVSRASGMGKSSADVENVAAWAKGGLRMIGRAAAWPWLRRSITVTLVADQHNYAFSTIASDLWRIDTKSLRYAGRDSYLAWGDPEQLDNQLGPDWKDSTGTSGTPQYACRFGVELWIASKPSTTFVASYPSVYGYGWRNENYTGDSTINGGNLLLPDEFFEIAVESSLAFGFLAEDDPRAGTELNRARMMIREEMMGAAIDLGAHKQMIVPGWARQSWSSTDDYGDGNPVSY
uniref:Uncharacterized protein n=1 Tax=viral metagenome TaxID=1070528 RepID=A0A6H1ZCF4_9ZZZZ